MVGGHRPIKIALDVFFSTIKKYSETNINTIVNINIKISDFLNLLNIVNFYLGKTLSMNGAFY